jgi:oligo-1,6-glucosidase
MQWDGGPKAGFTSGTPWIPLGRRSSNISVAAEEQAERSVLEEYRKLLRLRKVEPALRRGSFLVTETGNGELFSFRKALGSDELLVLVNLTGRKAALTADSTAAKALETANALGNAPRGEGASPAPTRVYGNYREREPRWELAPYEAVIYRLKGGKGRQ